MKPLLTVPEIMDPLVVMDAGGIHVAAQSVSEKLERKNLSPSLVSGLEQCPAKWFGESFVLKDLVQEEPDNAARRGGLYHKIMEDFFTLEAEERTHEALRATMNEVLKSDDYRDMAAMPEALEWLKNAINGYFRMGGKPQQVEVATVRDPKSGKERLGLEVFVKGRLGDTKREILGFVDRLVRDKRQGGEAVIIEDWKSGAKAKRWNPANKGNEGLAEARQQFIYAELLGGEGYSMHVTGARLIYPVAQEMVTVDLGNEKLREKVYSSVQEADEKLDIFTANNTFEYGPSFLCAWCPLAKICPSATIKPYAKMQDAYAQQPEPEVLLRGIEMR